MHEAKNIFGFQQYFKLIYIIGKLWTVPFFLLEIYSLCSKLMLQLFSFEMSLHTEKCLDTFISRPNLTKAATINLEQREYETVKSLFLLQVTIASYFR
jgi:hypothetical protein